MTEELLPWDLAEAIAEPERVRDTRKPEWRAIRVWAEDDTVVRIAWNECHYEKLGYWPEHMQNIRLAARAPSASDDCPMGGKHDYVAGLCRDCKANVPAYRAPSAESAGEWHPISQLPPEGVAVHLRRASGADSVFKFGIVHQGHFVMGYHAGEDPDACIPVSDGVAREWRLARPAAVEKVNAQESHGEICEIMPCSACAAKAVAAPLSPAQRIKVGDWVKVVSGHACMREHYGNTAFKVLGLPAQIGGGYTCPKCKTRDIAADEKIAAHLIAGRDAAVPIGWLERIENPFPPPPLVSTLRERQRTEDRMVRRGWLKAAKVDKGTVGVLSVNAMKEFKK